MRHIVLSYTFWRLALNISARVKVNLFPGVNDYCGQRFPLTYILPGCLREGSALKGYSSNQVWKETTMQFGTGGPASEKRNVTPSGPSTSKWWLNHWLDTG